MKGYKAFDSTLSCRGMKYEIGKEYTFDGKLIPCKQGFHFCKSIADCYRFYPMRYGTRICEVKAIGKIETDDNIKYCTNVIRIVREIENPRLSSNVSATSSGYCNVGGCNSGNRNTGDCNSGQCNSGNRNTGDCNTGNWNTGDCNSGDCNTGNRNTGHSNAGNCNIGNLNSGDYNIGNFNSGDYNIGDWNSGKWNSGVFNTKNDLKIKMFDVDSDWTFSDWGRSDAFYIMRRCPSSYSDFISETYMSSEEKEQHPEYKTIGGYTKTVIVTDYDKQKWWDELPDEYKQVIYALPNFSKEKFEECVGIKIKE